MTSSKLLSVKMAECEIPKRKMIVRKHENYLAGPAVIVCSEIGVEWCESIV